LVERCAAQQSTSVETRGGTKEKFMTKLSTEDKTKGKIHEVKGTIKEKVGELTNNPELEADGNTEKNAGKVQNLVGKIEKAIGQ
jgi:uncharacterized protein YjbJ (UPF0337 family)